MPAKDNPPRTETKVIRTRVGATPHREQVTPLYMASGFTFDSAEQARAVYVGEQPGYVYTRWDNPNNDELVARLCALEGAEAGLPMASGMAAIFTVLAGLLNSGDHVVASRSLFGATHQLLTTVMPRWGISHSYADCELVQTWPALFRPETRLCLVETPSNPGLTLVDLGWVAELCRERGVVLVVDNTFATPVIQRPLAFGADLVVHSTTKFLDGQGRTIGGVIAGDRLLINELTHFARQTGPTLSPFNSWLLSQSLETLSLRMERHCANAQHVAGWLAAHPAVGRVHYPGLASHPQHHLAQRLLGGRGYGGMVAFELRDATQAAAFRFLDSLKLILPATTLGDVYSLALYPVMASHRAVPPAERLRLGISDGLLRLSIGIEDPADIVADLEQALGAVNGG